MDTSQYLELFIDETKEHLQSLNEHILELEKEPEDTDTINEIFRAAHTLKGMAGTMGYTRMQRLTRLMVWILSDNHYLHIIKRTGIGSASFSVGVSKREACIHRSSRLSISKYLLCNHVLFFFIFNTNNCPCMATT